MDSIDLEREKGITIMAKNTAISYRGRPHQHRRHAGPRRLRLGGRAHAHAGRRRAAPGRRRRGAAAADPLRAEEGARGEPAADRRHQQDRPERRPPRRGARRDLRPVHRSRGHRGPARVPGALHQRADRHRHAQARRARALARAAVRDDPRDRPGAALRAGRGAAVPRAPCSTGTTTSAGSSSAASSTAGSARPSASPSCTATARSSSTKVTVLYGYEGLKRVEIAEASAGDLVAIAGIECDRDRRDGGRRRGARWRCRSSASTSRRCRCSSRPTSRRSPARRGASSPRRSSATGS